jgi:hypothetical protein
MTTIDDFNTARSILRDALENALDASIQLDSALNECSINGELPDDVLSELQEMLPELEALSLSISETGWSLSVWDDPGEDDDEELPTDEDWNVSSDSAGLDALEHG